MGAPINLHYNEFEFEMIYDMSDILIFIKNFFRVYAYNGRAHKVDEILYFLRQRVWKNGGLRYTTLFKFINYKIRGSRYITGYLFNEVIIYLVINWQCYV